MRIPTINNSINNENIKKIKISMNNPYKMNYYDDCEILDFDEDPKSYVKYIKKIERIVRDSSEYKNYVTYLKENLNMNKCTFFNNYDNDNYDISVEIHHSPFTLYDICAIILKRYQALNRDFSQLEIANKVTELHYRGLVGLVPLSKTVHKLYHKGDLFIPINNVYGDVRKFYLTYEKFIDEELKDKLRNLIQASKLFNDNDYNPSVLERKFTYIDVEGFRFPSKINIEQIMTA